MLISYLCCRWDFGSLDHQWGSLEEVERAYSHNKREVITMWMNNDEGRYVYIMTCP